MITYQQARQTIQDVAGQYALGTELVPLSAIAGRICAEDITAPLDIQPFDNAAMDGYALRCADLAMASAGNPVRLKKTHLIAAGNRILPGPVQPSTCVRIMTGAPLPLGADCVVPFELTTTDGDDVFFTARSEKAANIRFAGEDFRKGDVVLSRSIPLTAAHIMPLATLGIHRVRVFRRVRAIFIATGGELVDDLEASLQPGQIYNSNCPYSLAMLQALGGDCVAAYTIPDEPDVFAKLLAAAIEEHSPDLVISSGAVSAGDFDFVRATLEKLGAEILFHKVKIKPGKPNLFAKLPQGSLYFGLPGNPVATAVGLRFFVEPALRAMTQRAPEQPLYAKSTSPFTKKPGLFMFLKARISCSARGELLADLLEGQASFMVSPFTRMNGWVTVEEENSNLGENELVAFYPAQPDSF